MDYSAADADADSGSETDSGAGSDTDSAADEDAAESPAVWDDVLFSSAPAVSTVYWICESVSGVRS